MKTHRIRIPFLAAAIVATAYFVTLKIVEPIGFQYVRPSYIFNFSLVWLVIAAILLIPAFPESGVARKLSRALWGGRRRKIATVTGTIFAGAFACASLALAAWIMTPIADGSLVSEESLSNGQTATEYLIALGGGIKLDGTVSLALKSRLDATIAYLALHPETRVVVTGGKSRDLPRTEGSAMAEYLFEYGDLGADRVLSEEAARDTIQNLANVREIILNDMKKETGRAQALPSVIILTNEFHLKRALYLARKAGYERPRGIAAPSPLVMLPQNLLREVGAWWKLGIRQAALGIQGKKLFGR